MPFSAFPILNVNGYKSIVILICISLLLLFSTNYLFLSEGLYIQTFEKQIAIERISKMFEVSQKWQWIGYVFVPIEVLIRICFTAICIYTGSFLANIKVRFKEMFKVALLSDFVFVLAGVTKLVDLIFFKDISTINDLQFQPLSLLELFNRTSVDPLFTYPFSLISVFELLYWLTLAWLLSGVIEKPFGNSLKIVASSYGIGLLLWVLFVVFLTVNLT